MATRTLTFTGTGYTAHDTDEIWFTLWDDADNVTPVETLTTATDGMGNIDETWSMTLIDGHSYTLYWVADEMDNGTCDAPPDDHGWSESFGPVAGDVTVDYDHDGNFDNTACDNTVIE
jgi:hypothetical protein